jgi:hypothetical protein
MQAGAGVVTVCMHPDAVTTQHTTAGGVRYERKIKGPGYGMIRRVKTEPMVYFERVCPDCPAREMVIGSAGHDSVSISLSPWMTTHRVNEESQ